MEMTISTRARETEGKGEYASAAAGFFALGAYLLAENPDRILDYQYQRYLIKEIGDGVAVIVTGKNMQYDTIYELITQLTDDGNLYDSIEEAVEDVVDKERKGESPNRDIRC